MNRIDALSCHGQLLYTLAGRHGCCCRCYRSSSISRLLDLRVYVSRVLVYCLACVAERCNSGQAEDVVDLIFSHCAEGMYTAV